MTDSDIARQQQEIEALKNELESINRNFDKQKKALGLREGEEITVNEAEIPQMVKDAMKKMEDEARKNGLARSAAEAQNSTPSAPARRRRGALHI